MLNVFSRVTLYLSVLMGTSALAQGSLRTNADPAQEDLVRALLNIDKVILAIAEILDSYGQESTPSPDRPMEHDDLAHSILNILIRETTSLSEYVQNALTFPEGSTEYDNAINISCVKARGAFQKAKIAAEVAKKPPVGTIKESDIKERIMNVLQNVVLRDLRCGREP